MSFSLGVCVCCVGSGLCSELITLSEKSYRVFVSTCERSIHVDKKAPNPELGWRATKIKQKVFNELKQRDKTSVSVGNYILETPRK